MEMEMEVEIEMENKNEMKGQGKMEKLIKDQNGKMENNGKINGIER